MGRNGREYSALMRDLYHFGSLRRSDWLPVGEDPRGNEQLGRAHAPWRITKPLPRPPLAITKPLPHSLWQLPSHDHASLAITKPSPRSFGHYLANTTPPFVITNQLPSSIW